MIKVILADRDDQSREFDFDIEVWIILVSFTINRTYIRNNDLLTTPFLY